MKEKIERNKLIMKMKNKGKTIREIAHFFNISFWACRSIVRRMKGEDDGRDWKREQIRKYFSFTCQNCGRIWKLGERKFDVHHFGRGSLDSRKYDTGKIDPEMVTLLCHKCHLNLPEHREAMSNSYNKNKKAGPALAK